MLRDRFFPNTSLLLLDFRSLIRDIFRGGFATASAADAASDSWRHAQRVRWITPNGQTDGRTDETERWAMTTETWRGMIWNHYQADRCHRLGGRHHGALPRTDTLGGFVRTATTRIASYTIIFHKDWIRRTGKHGTKSGPVFSTSWAVSSVFNVLRFLFARCQRWHYRFASKTTSMQHIKDDVNLTKLVNPL